MLDPFPSPPPTLVASIQPIADRLSLATLPLHLHEIIFGWACYQIIYTVLSPIISTWLFSSIYPRLPPRTKTNWDVHITSFVQSSFITISALLVIWGDEERNDMNWAGRIWGYTGAGGAVQGFAAGYFLWDLTVSIMHLDVLGVGSLAHAVSALLITSLGFRPFANYYGLNFILYEISTPFLNIHWFLDKANMTGSKIQLYNGIALLTTFFGSRVLWGNFQSLHIYSDVWKALNTRDFNSTPLGNNAISAYQKSASGTAVSGDPSNLTVPIWLAITYLGSNTVLNFLNVYWFGKMIQALLKRFQSPSVSSKREKVRPKSDVREHVE